jgi:hypothetical protein
MISEKQLLANRQNALRSTGPRTATGKSIASQNAIRHGLSAENTVIPGEDPEEFNQFRQLLLDDLAPAGAMEVFLADRIVAGFWKLHRAARIETELLKELNSSPLNPDDGKQKDEIPFSVCFTRTYNCPVHDRVLERNEPPTDCESCSLTPKPETPESDTAAPTATENDPNSPAQDKENIDPPAIDREREVEPTSPQPLALGRIFKSDMAGGNILARFRLYEAQIERSLYKALTELQKFQILRSNLWMASPDHPAGVLDPLVPES